MIILSGYKVSKLPLLVTARLVPYALLFGGNSVVMYDIHQLIILYDQHLNVF